MRASWNGKAVVEMLRDFGLSEYEARIYFVSLTIGEAKVGVLTKRACVPQSKGYEILDRLVAKGFVEQSEPKSPKEYHAKPLERVVLGAIVKQKRFLRRLNNDFESLQKTLQTIGPLYERYGVFRLFSPFFAQRKAWTRLTFQRASMRSELMCGLPKELPSRATATVPDRG